MFLLRRGFGLVPGEPLSVLIQGSGGAVWNRVRLDALGFRTDGRVDGELIAEETMVVVRTGQP